MTRIHTLVISNMLTGEVLVDEFYEYAGPVAECKKDTAAPDYSQVAVANEKQAQVAADQLAWYKEVYAENKDMMDASTQQAMDYQKSMTDALNYSLENAKLDRDRYNKNFAPLEDALAKETIDAGGAADQEAGALRAKGDLAAGLANQKAASQRALMSMGINPNSAKFATSTNADTIAAAAQEGSAMTRAREAAKQLGWAKRMDAISVGKGLPSQQTAAMSTASAMGVNGTNAAATALNSQNSMASMVGQGYNGQLSAWNNIAGSNEKMATNTASMMNQANAAESQGTGQMIGTVVGAAAAVF